MYLSSGITLDYGATNIDARGQSAHGLRSTQMGFERVGLTRLARAEGTDTLYRVLSYRVGLETFLKRRIQLVRV